MNHHQLADQINSMREGEMLQIERHVVADLPGTWHETGWERTLANVFGSAHADLWDFHQDPLTGAMVVRRLKE